MKVGLLSVIGALASMGLPASSGARPVSGFADLHVHQMAEYAWAGGFIWGRHKGPIAQALPRCSGGLDHGFLAGEGLAGLHLKRRGGYPTFDGWPRWDAVAHHTVHETWLKKAHEDGLNLIVMSAGNDAPFCGVIPKKYRRADWGCDDMRAVDRMIQAAHDFAASRDWYEIARSPADARRIIHQGKLAVVLGIEASAPFGRGNLVQQLDTYYRLGVRNLHLAHLMNSRFAGTAPVSGSTKMLQILQHLQTGNKVDRPVKLDRNKLNKLGLTTEGKRLVREMMKRKMLIDTAHISERAFRAVFDLARANRYYPIYRSHTYLRELRAPKHRDERTTAGWMVSAIKTTGGMIGLRTGPEEILTYSRSGVANNCQGSSRSFAQMYTFASKGLGVPVAFGGDLNGLIGQVVPRFGDQACIKAPKFERAAQQQAQGSRTQNGIGTPFDTKGFAHVGLESHLIRDLKKLGVDTRNVQSSAEAFIRMWERAYDPNRRKLPGAVDVSGVEPYLSTKERRKAGRRQRRAARKERRRSRRRK